MRETRRQVLRSLAGAGLILPGLLSELLSPRNAGANANDLANPLAAKQPHFAPKAKRVIFLFMTGGVSHIDTFDHKPLMNKQHNTLYKKGRYYKGSGWKFRPYGQSAIEVSDLFPHIGSVIDEVCLINSMKNLNGDHFGATIGIHTGSGTFNRPKKRGRHEIQRWPSGERPPPGTMPCRCG